MKVETIIELRQKNKKDILNFIRFRDKVTKREVSQELGLSFATVSNMVNDLRGEGIVEEVEGDMRKNVGRNPQYIHICRQRYFVVAFEMFEKYTMRLSLVDLRRGLLGGKSYEIQSYTHVDGFLSQLEVAYEDFRRSYCIEIDRILGVGVVVYGIYDHQKKVISASSQRAWLEKPIGDLLAAVFQKPVEIENDANLAACYRATADGVNNLIYVYLYDGLGIGVVVNKQLLFGAGGYSSEIGHISMGKLEKKCDYCGKMDCIQTDLIRSGFVKKYFDEDCSGDAYRLETLWQAYIKALEEKDPRAVEVSLENGKILAKILSVAALVCRPEKILLGGLPSAVFAVLQPLLYKEINDCEPMGATIAIEMDADFYDTIEKGAAELVYDAWTFA